MKPGEQVKIGKVEGKVKFITLGLPGGPRIGIETAEGKIVSVIAKQRKPRKER